MPAATASCTGIVDFVPSDKPMTSDPRENMKVALADTTAGHIPSSKTAGLSTPSRSRIGSRAVGIDLHAGKSAGANPATGITWRHRSESGSKAHTGAGRRHPAAEHTAFRTLRSVKPSTQHRVYHVESIKQGARSTITITPTRGERQLQARHAEVPFDDTDDLVLYG